MANKIRYESIEPGMVIGNLRVVEELEPGPKGMRRWLCHCECGNDVVANNSVLLNRTMTTCGCTGQAEDLTGQRFGMLTVLSRATNSSSGVSRWLCKCDCGNEKIVNIHILKHKTRVPSCGCYGKKKNDERSTKHGLTGTHLWRVWQGMKQRCYNPQNVRYDRYGGRGIYVCDRWKDNFENFYSDMGASYQPGLQLDRIDNDGPYSPENCHWVTVKENSRNRGNNVVVESLYGEMTIPELAETSGVNEGTLRSRLRLGYPEELLTVPLSQQGQKLSDIKQLMEGEEAQWIDEKTEEKLHEAIDAVEQEAFIKIPHG